MKNLEYAAGNAFICAVCIQVGMTPFCPSSIKCKQIPRLNNVNVHVIVGSIKMVSLTNCMLSFSIHPVTLFTHVCGHEKQVFWILVSIRNYFYQRLLPQCILLKMLPLMLPGLVSSIDMQINCM
jgi:hypothetical protein